MKKTIRINVKDDGLILLDYGLFDDRFADWQINAPIEQWKEYVDKRQAFEEVHFALSELKRIKPKKK